MTKSPGLRAVNLADPDTGQPASEEALAAAFPVVDPSFRPFGSRVLVQFRTTLPFIILKSGQKFHLTDEARDTEKWNTQVAKVIATGPLAFHHRQTQAPWPEGAWAPVGGFVRVPKYGTGDRWEVTYGPLDHEKAMFALYNDLDLLGAVTGDPLRVKAFL